MKMIDKNGLKVSLPLLEFINNEVIPGTNLNSEKFWKKFSSEVHELSPINKSLIQKRESIQKKIDDWHKSNQGKDLNKIEYKNFLKSIGYLIEEENDFKIETADVDKEISSIAGPQLVVPVDNARYALNAANARWGSLYDALYGTDVITGEIPSNWSQERAIEVINFVRNFLDENFPLTATSWKEISKIQVDERKLTFISDTVKHFLKNQTIYKNNSYEIEYQNLNKKIKIITKKPVYETKTKNSRSRSAKLRVAERIL